MERLTAHPNLTHDTNPTYLQQFVDSDALIHDGCSFLAGYFFTDNPQCYMLPENRNLKDIFDVVGLECLGMVYKAYSEKGITDFLDSVVLGGRDDMREVRQAFLKNNLMRNHPYVGKSILRHMEEAFSGI